MKKFFKKVAAFFVTAYANRIYKQAVTAAELRYDEEKDMIFVITDPSEPSRLMVMNLKQFLDLRHRFRIPSKELTIQTLKNRCWYHTKSKLGREALTEEDKTVRRLAFVREALRRAKVA